MLRTAGRRALGRPRRLPAALLALALLAAGGCTNPTAAPAAPRPTTSPAARTAVEVDIDLAADGSVLARYDLSFNLDFLGRLLEEPESKATVPARPEPIFEEEKIRAALARLAGEGVTVKRLEVGRGAYVERLVAEIRSRDLLGAGLAASALDVGMLYRLARNRDGSYTFAIEERKGLFDVGALVPKSGPEREALKQQVRKMLAGVRSRTTVSLPGRVTRTGADLCRGRSASWVLDGDAPDCLDRLLASEGRAKEVSFRGRGLELAECGNHRYIIRDWEMSIGADGTVRTVEVHRVHDTMLRELRGLARAAGRGPGQVGEWLREQDVRRSFAAGAVEGSELVGVDCRTEGGWHISRVTARHRDLNAAREECVPRECTLTRDPDENFTLTLAPPSPLWSGPGAAGKGIGATLPDGVLARFDTQLHSTFRTSHRVTVPGRVLVSNSHDKAERTAIWTFSPDVDQFAERVQARSRSGMWLVFKGDDLKLRAFPKPLPPRGGSGGMAGCFGYRDGGGRKRAVVRTEPPPKPAWPELCRRKHPWDGLAPGSWRLESPAASRSSGPEQGPHRTMLAAVSGDTCKLVDCVDRRGRPAAAGPVKGLPSMSTLEGLYLWPSSLGTEELKIGGRARSCGKTEYVLKGIEGLPKVTLWNCPQLEVARPEVSLKGTGVLLPPDTVRVEVASAGSDGAASCWQLQAAAQSVRVGGRAVSCDIWKSWSVLTDGRPRDERTVWLSLDVPGWLVKDREARLADFQTLDAAREHGGQPIPRGPWAGVRTGGWVLYEDGRLLRAAAVNSLGLPAIEELRRSEAGGWKTVRTEVLFPAEPYAERPFQMVDGYRATLETEGGPLQCTVQTYRGLDDAARTSGLKVWRLRQPGERRVHERQVDRAVDGGSMDGDIARIIYWPGGNILDRRIVRIGDEVELAGRKLWCVEEIESWLATQDDGARTAYRTARVWTCPQVPGRTVRERDDQSEEARCLVRDFDSSGLRPLPETERK